MKLLLSISAILLAASGIETFFFPGGEPHARIPKDFGSACSAEYAQVTVADVDHAADVCKNHNGWMYILKESFYTYKCTSAPITVYCSDGNRITFYAKGECL
jgi:hypothetical protein